ncbi:MAG: sodium:alanine symporter family protein [Desulfobacteraceae bacterium]|nr:sodium:alanine symporter family protein [Desulfobacteraceae bacterium]
METLNELVGKINSFAWGPFMISFLVGTGVILTIGTRVVQWRKLGHAFKLLFSKSYSGQGDITPFQALMTSLSATIGTGNIAGVATAIASGGPGAVFWMWITAAVGGATKFAEAVLAVKYRITNKKGEKSGGPMHYIKLGMKERFGGNWTWLGWAFAFFGFIAAFGIGNMVQSNSVADAVNNTFNVPYTVTGAVIAILTALVIIGGIKSIAMVTSKIVPAMALIYVSGALVILYLRVDAVPEAFALILSNAFSGKAVGGALLGTVVRYGVARGIFSNESGLGSAPIAHAASKSDSPVRQAIIASLSPFIDTLVICTMTALVILVSGLVSFDQSGLMSIAGDLSGAALTTTAFSRILPGFGSFIVAFGLVFFAFSTILGWYYYGSKCFEFILGVKAIFVYKFLWVAAVYIGATVPLKFVWNISDTFNGLMAIPNLIGLLALSPVIFAMTRKYDQDLKRK